MLFIISREMPLRYAFTTSFSEEKTHAMICISYILKLKIFNKMQYKHNVMNDHCQHIVQCPYICLLSNFLFVFASCLYTKMTSFQFTIINNYKKFYTHLIRFQFSLGPQLSHPFHKLIISLYKKKRSKLQSLIFKLEELLNDS